MELKWTDNVNNNLSLPIEVGLASLYHENSKIFQAREFDHAAELQIGRSEKEVCTRGFKKFNNSKSFELTGLKSSRHPLQKAMVSRRSRRDLSGPVNLEELSTILAQSLGITAIVQNEEQQLIQYLRAWPSAGGLYPIDTYIIASHVKDLPSGIYHFNVIQHRLENIGNKSLPDCTEVLKKGFFRQEFIVQASLTILLVACFTRTRVKYGERGYRLVLLDAGHAAQNILLTCEQQNINATPIAGFCDNSLAEDLLLDGINESVVHCISIGKPKT